MTSWARLQLYTGYAPPNGRRQIWSLYFVILGLSILMAIWLAYEGHPAWLSLMRAILGSAVAGVLAVMNQCHEIQDPESEPPLQDPPTPNPATVRAKGLSRRNSDD